MDEVLRLKPANDFNSRLDRIMRLSNAISTLQVNWNLTQQPDVPLKERYPVMVSIFHQRIAQDAKEETPRWTPEQRERFLRLLHGLQVFGFVSTASLYLLAAALACSAFLWVKSKFEMPPDEAVEDM